MAWSEQPQVLRPPCATCMQDAAVRWRGDAPAGQQAGRGAAGEPRPAGQPCGRGRPDAPSAPAEQRDGRQGAGGDMNNVMPGLPGPLGGITVCLAGWLPRAIPGMHCNAPCESVSIVSRGCAKYLINSSAVSASWPALMARCSGCACQLCPVVLSTKAVGAHARFSLMAMIARTINGCVCIGCTFTA